MIYTGRARNPATVIIGDSESMTLFNVVGINPHVDTDITIVWTGGKPTTIEVVGLGKTKTMTLSWTADELDSIATVIT